MVKHARTRRALRTRLTRSLKIFLVICELGSGSAVRSTINGIIAQRCTAPAHVVLERLAASSPSDRLARALTMLGRVVKTTYIMRYLHDLTTRRANYPGQENRDDNSAREHHDDPPRDEWPVS